MHYRLCLHFISPFDFFPGFPWSFSTFVSWLFTYDHEKTWLLIQLFWNMFLLRKLFLRVFMQKSFSERHKKVLSFNEKTLFVIRKFYETQPWRKSRSKEKKEVSWHRSPRPKKFEIKMLWWCSIMKTFFPCLSSSPITIFSCPSP